MKKSVFPVLVLMLLSCVYADSIPVANHSFEDPVAPSSDPYALPYVTDWIELDNDPVYGANTGVFYNITGIAGADANQIAFLGGEKGNALLQDLGAVYQVGKSYKMTVGVCVSGAEAPSDPNGLELAFYYTSPEDPNRFDIVTATTVAPSNFSTIELEDESVYLPVVQTGDAWAGKSIGIALRGTGPFGGFWDLDNVRVVEYPLVPNFTDDSIVNLADFAIMAIDWLYCDEPPTDVTGEGCVDENDLLILMEYWLSNV